MRGIYQKKSMWNQADFLGSCAIWENAFCYPAEKNRMKSKWPCVKYNICWKKKNIYYSSRKAPVATLVELMIKILRMVQVNYCKLCRAPKCSAYTCAATIKLVKVNSPSAGKNFL